METYVKTLTGSAGPRRGETSISLTLDEWYAIWFRQYKADRLKPSTLQNYSSIYRNQIRERIGSMPINEIRSAHIQQMYNGLREKGVSPKYQRCIYAILSNMFDIAAQNGLIPQNPCRNVRMDALQRKEERFLSAEEHRLLMEILLRKEWEPLSFPVITLSGTGMRIGELLGLTWDNVDIQARHIYIEKTLVYLWDSDAEGYAFSFQTPKTRRSRRGIPMSQTVADALRKQKEKVRCLKNNRKTWNPLPGFENLVFPNSHGRPRQRRDIQNLLDRLVEAANQQQPASPQGAVFHMDPIHPHTLRHSFATRCFEAGIQPKVVQTLLGHSSIQVTMDLYTHVSFEKCRKDMEKLQQFGV